MIDDKEVRRYKIVGFRDDQTKIRVLLEDAPLVKSKDDMSFDTDSILKNPMGMAQKLMGKQMSQIIRDSFSISRKEYLKEKYMVGDYVFVTINREG